MNKVFSRKLKNVRDCSQLENSKTFNSPLESTNQPARAAIFNLPLGIAALPKVQSFSGLIALIPSRNRVQAVSLERLEIPNEYWFRLFKGSLKLRSDRK